MFREKHTTMSQNRQRSKEVTSSTSTPAYSLSSASSSASVCYIVSLYTTICWSSQTSNNRQRDTRHVVFLERTTVDQRATCRERRLRVIDALPALDQRHRLILNYEFILSATATAISGPDERLMRPSAPTSTPVKCDRESLLRSLTFVGVRIEDPTSSEFCDFLRNDARLRATVTDVFTVYVSNANLNTWSSVYRNYLWHELQNPLYNSDKSAARDNERDDNDPNVIYDKPGPPRPVDLDTQTARNSCEFIEGRISDIVDSL